MKTNSTDDPLGGELYLAGERVAPGIYKQIGGLRELCLDHEDYLPASLDGRVACYERVQHTWAQMEVRMPGDRRTAQKNASISRYSKAGDCMNDRNVLQGFGTEIHGHLAHEVSATPSPEFLHDVALLLEIDPADMLSGSDDVGPIGARDNDNGGEGGNYIWNATSGHGEVQDLPS